MRVLPHRRRWPRRRRSRRLLQHPHLPAPTVEAVKKLYADREFEEIKLDGMRKTIAARLSEAKQTIPHFYLRREIRLDELLAFRAQLNAELEARKVKLSVNDFIIKAGALALQQVPEPTRSGRGIASCA